MRKSYLEPKMKIEVYTTPYCPYCQAAKDLLKGKKIHFEEINVSDDEDFDELVEKTGWKTVPQIFIDGKMIGGFEELQAFLCLPRSAATL